jgi:hypothetical protein
LKKTDQISRRRAAEKFRKFALAIGDLLIAA